ncbi:MAG: rhamnulokinase family protein [Pyrinomonadaceae bacterium]
MGAPLYISVDLGAGSGRVFLVSFEIDRLFLEEIRRFHYPPRIVDGRLSWDFNLIFENVSLGIKEAVDRAGRIDGDLVSVGVDSWGVDYGLLDSDGRLVSDPACYRDRRTESVLDEVFERVSKSDIFNRTGIQFLDFNTLYQLYADRERLSEVATFLLLPDLINNRLCGTRAAEFTNATTTQMLNVIGRGWDSEMLSRLDLDTSIFPEIVEPATVRGTFADGTLKVVSVASHDTASAVAAAPLTPNSAYISSGTWSLVGVELQHPLVNDEVSKANFTNEGGVDRTTRFLKNVMGLWLLERCRVEWSARGIGTNYDDLVEAAFRRTESESLIYPDDPRFVNPKSMLDAIRVQLIETGQQFDDDPVTVARLIFDSLAFRYASVLRTAGELTQIQISRVEVLGGGGRNRYLNQMTANATGVTVRAGLFEATVVGNAAVQAIAAGQFKGISDARSHIEEVTDFEEFVPLEIDPALHTHYAEIEKRFS